MSRLALLYMTREGQTRKITHHIADALQKKGHEVLISDIGDLKNDFSLEDFDGVILGCSVRYGRHHLPFRRFIVQHAAALSERPSFFFSVNLTARKPGRNLPENNRYLQKFMRSMSWQPDIVEVFAGALLYPQYHWLDREMIRLIMRITKGPVNISQSTEFTDWERVQSFAQNVDQSLITRVENAG